MTFTNSNSVSLKNATLGQIIQAIAAKMEEKDLKYTEEELAAASKNIKTAISRINCAWNRQNSPIFRLPDQLILRIFEDLQSVDHENSYNTRTKWWKWLRVMSVCRTWWNVSVGGPSLWETVHVLPKMPHSFLNLVLDRTGGRPLAVHFRACDFRNQHIPLYEALAAHRIKSFTTQIPDTPYCLPKVFHNTPYPDLESLDISCNAPRTSPSRTPNQHLYQSDATEDQSTSAPMHSIPTAQLKHLTLRYIYIIKGWLPTGFGNLTHLTLFGYADFHGLAEAVRGNPALQTLRLESIKYGERYSYHPRWHVNLDGQTLELVRCGLEVLGMFTLSSRCSLLISRTTDQSAVKYEWGVPWYQWLPKEISTIQCLHEIEELRFSVTKMTMGRGWIAAEQKTVGYPALDSTSESELKPLATFILTYHYSATAPPQEISFEPLDLLPHPIPWGKVTRASFDSFNDQFKICDDAVFKSLPNLRSLELRRCASETLVQFLTPDELPALERLRFEDESSTVELGAALTNALGIRHIQSKPRLRLGSLKIVTSGDPSSIFTTEQTERLKELVHNFEVTRTPGYRPVVYSTDV